MLHTQKEYIEFLKLCQNAIEKTNIELQKDNKDEHKALFADIQQDNKNLKQQIKTESISFYDWLTLLSNNIKEISLIVPVVGAFSAGKSSLLNSFLGKKYLSEGIAPETALATELRYSHNEYIEGVREDSTLQKFSIHDTEMIKQKANEFSYLRFYINAEKLKSIEPLVLVDMPGFESPLDLHNRAIFQYVQKGVYFIALQSIEDGNITKTMLRKLEEIDRFERKFSFFLSKTNLKPPSEIERVKDYVQEQLDTYFDSTEVMLLDNKENENLKRVLDSINAEKLIYELFAPTLQSIAFDIEKTIEIKAESYRRSKEDNEAILQYKTQELEKVEQEQATYIADAQNKYSNGSVNRIVNNTIMNLSRNADEIAQAYKSRGQAGADIIINDLIRSQLTEELKDSIGNIAKDITYKFNQSLESLNTSQNNMQNLNLPNRIYVDAGLLSKGTQSIIRKGIKTLIGAGGIAASLGGALKFALPVLNPLIGILITFIPSILASLFSDDKKKNDVQEELRQIANAIRTQTIPQIETELRKQIPEIFNTQVQEMIKTIGEQYKEKILQEQQAIEIAQKEIESKNLDIESCIKICKETIESIRNEANRLFHNKG